MKRLIVLMSAAIIAASFTTSCQLMHHPYDEDNAQKLAIEYMKEKYDKEIEVTDTYCQKHGSDKYVGVKFKLDETDNESSDDSTYEVRVYGNKDTQYQYVKCDNYMNTLFVPFMEEEIGNVLEKNGIKDYLVVVTRVFQTESSDWEYYSSDFSIPSANSSLNYYLQNNQIGSRCYIILPDKEKLSIESSQSCIDFISNIIKPLFDDDYMTLRLYICHDEDFKFAKEHDSDEYKSYISYDKYITKE